MAAVLPHGARQNIIRSKGDVAGQVQYLVRSQSQGAYSTEANDERAGSGDRAVVKEGVRVLSGENRFQHGLGVEQQGAVKTEAYEGGQNVESPIDQPIDIGKTSEKHHQNSSETEATVTHENVEKETVLKLSPARLYEVTTSPTWLPRRNSTEDLDVEVIAHANGIKQSSEEGSRDRSQSASVIATPTSSFEESHLTSLPPSKADATYGGTSNANYRTSSTPLMRKRVSSSKGSGGTDSQNTSSTRQLKISPLPFRLDEKRLASKSIVNEEPEPSPMPQTVPLPPKSLPTYLQLELSSQRPSPLYIHRSIVNDSPYEPLRVKIDRLKNFFLLPPQLEQVLWFGAFACLDAWLYSFTILPLRFLKALAILARYWGRYITSNTRLASSFLYGAIARLLHSTGLYNMDKHPTAKAVRATDSKSDVKGTEISVASLEETHRKSAHKRWSSTSEKTALSADHKADILKGLLILISCILLMYFDASRMYHGIRGQAAIKLYVIYNVLEVCDRLFSAIGQDVLECLFSREALEDKPNGQSNVWRPFWLFLLAVCYNLVHSIALFYQVITLNVAVNSYSNALLTLLMSNQFVEIKGTVFKKIEKENLFQLTCADVVERFQLWLMLLIIASRNIIETGAFNFAPTGGHTNGQPASASSSGASSILAKMLPDWTGQVMGPFLLVLGSEMLVDWIKHAYITKFNNTKPAIYGRFLDVLAKDYYSNAFADQNLTRRLGLPVIPLACLFIRASVQTYHMFLATHMPSPLPSTATSISLESATAPPVRTAALQHIDQIFRRALGRSTFGAGDDGVAPLSTGIWNLDDVVAYMTMALFFLVLYLVLLALKLVLGIALLSFARSRYKGMKVRESQSAHADGKRVGGWGVVEVDEDKRRWIYQDDPVGARKLRERERDTKEKEKRIAKEGGESFEGVNRYSMVAKRIW